MRKREKIANNRRTALCERGWYFTKKDNRYIAFMGGDKDNTLISCGTSKGLLQRIQKKEIEMKSNVFVLKFSGVSSLMVTDLQKKLNSLKSNNTIWVDFKAYGCNGHGDDYYVDFYYYQYENDPKPILELIAEKEILKLVDLANSSIV